MARTIWKGALSFGLVNVPVGLYPATQDKAIHFNQLEEGTSDRIRYKKVNERTGEEVEAGKIVKGFDLGGGEYVILTDDELAAAEPERSKLVEITDFVDLDEIDPVFYRSTYYLAPEGEAAGKAYALLRQAMRESNKIAIGTLVMRNKEYPVAIRPDDDVLTLETMYFSDEIRSPSKELPDLPNVSELTEREIVDGTAPRRVDGVRVGPHSISRYAPPEGPGPCGGETEWRRDRHPLHGAAGGEGRRPHGRTECQHRVRQGGGQGDQAPEGSRRTHHTEEVGSGQKGSPRPQGRQSQVTDQHHVEDWLEGSQPSKGVLTPTPRRRGPRGCRLFGAPRRL